MHYILGLHPCIVYISKLYFSKGCVCFTHRREAFIHNECQAQSVVRHENQLLNNMKYQSCSVQTFPCPLWPPALRLQPSSTVVHIPILTNEAQGYQ